MKKILILSILTTMASLVNAQEIKSVKNVDLNLYKGLWYEIARYPNSFEKGCDFVTAEYRTDESNRYVRVINSCTKNGKRKDIRGKAFVVKGSNNARLKVQFFWPFKGDYWIIKLAEDYRYAVVSEPEKNYLWILSRNSKMNEADLNEVKVFLKENGFELEKLVYPKQN